ncbi:LysR family transcriptional regulator [uncultured Dialister sp.]|uniref:LysR family transcriptional regulator n=1 Tax=uncultured Dialister sp. TaxID=278064 RepID=UPI0026702839|nr:LysR family transcriptional regulator [uncultured Dialister sp.]
METRVLRYFLAVAQEGSVTRAARALHLTQPTLSRQIRELEEELGQTLFSRGGRELSLTREGLLLRQRAEEIVGLAEITEKEFRSLGEKTVSGDLSLGCGESKALSFVTDALKVLQDEHPLIIPHFFSGNGEIVMDRLDKGLLDFAVLMGAENTERYYSLFQTMTHGAFSWIRMIPSPSVPSPRPFPSSGKNIRSSPPRQKPSSQRSGKQGRNRKML